MIQEQGISFEELFDRAAIQRIQDEFAAATGVASMITQPDGTPITRPSNFCRLCDEIIRRNEKGCANCSRSDALLGRHHPEGSIIQRCLSGGLCDAGASITVGDRHIANWLIGQIRDETQSEEKMREYARAIGAEEESVIIAFREVPSMSLVRFKQVAQALFTLANQLSTTAFQNVQQARYIAERQQAEEALKREQLFSEKLLDSLPGLFYLYSYPDLRLVRWNKNHETLLGYGVGEIKDHQILEWHESQARDAVLEAVAVVMEKGQNQLESNLLAKDGSPIPFLMTGVKLEAQGQSYLMGVGFEIASQKRAERALRENEARQNAMIANIADVIAIIDANGVNRYKTPNIQKWFGWSPEEVVGVSTWNNVHPEDIERTQQIFNAILREPNATAQGECRYRCKDGSYKWIEFTAVNLVHEPYIRGVLLNYRDHTEHKRAQDERNKLEGQLQQAQKMESVGRLAGGVAHDFNNMLQAILGNVDLAMGEIPAGSPARESLEEIRTCALRSSDLTRQLLAFARRQTIAPKVLDLNETVEGLLKTLRRLIGEDVQLAWLPAAELGLVKMDPTQIDQILANLCVNARDAIAGVGRISIETGNALFSEADCVDHSGFVPGEYIKLSVSDSGCGMDGDTLTHIFEPFFTTKGPGKGTGLGLSTIYGIVKQNNGFINVTSKPGKGTTFEIFLPRQGGAAMASRVECRAQLPRSSGETVLLVEDEPAILAIALRILERLGYTVLTASTPGDAIRLVEGQAGEIHLLLTDVVMPEMNGRDLARRLLLLRPKLKYLFMSGYTADVIAHNGVLYQDVRFIQKPFSMEDLAVKVREVLDQ